MGGADFYALAAFWQLEMQKLFGPDAYSIARVIIPFGFAFLIGIFLFSAGIDFSKGAIREVLLIASCMMTAGIGAMAAISQTTRGLSIGLSFLGMLGVGGVFVPAVIALMNVAGDDVIGTITGLGISIRFIGGQIGYTVFFNAFQSRLIKLAGILVGGTLLKAGFPPAEIPTFIGALLLNDVTVLEELPGVTPAILEAAGEAAIEATVGAFKIVYYAGIAFGGAAIIACLFLGNIRKYMTDRVAVDIH
jgi:Fungal trichothecene efflux pump (TRI12)